MMVNMFPKVHGVPNMMSADLFPTFHIGIQYGIRGEASRGTRSANRLAVMICVL